ncbi:Trk system potassium uptake protein TrkH [Piscirickettsia salmonis]|uniref:potassium transporter TrkG n=2 Tax=Piscirickettsia salmonis TaxID=1238 RepID=UPI0012BA04C0|nr:potassium transporter TrkG [Piscirickettsia salmonis]QGP51976.1 Trk system potassium uptake protein TrkH [Piscirickettsia salmonis]
MVQEKAILKIIGILLMLFSFSMLPPVYVSWLYQDYDATPFLISFCLAFFSGFLVWLPARDYKVDLKARDGFIIVFLFWLVLGVYSALPFMLSYHPHMVLSEAVFEAVSGFTTTGGTVLSHIENLPPSILYYRQQLQFLGGMGIIVLAIAVLPMMGVGGMQLYRAEVTGPVKDKLTPRITETAKTLWYIYVGLTVICIMTFWLFGMDLFNAICYGFGTISTGGYAPHDASAAFYSSPLIQYAMIFFMLIGGTNFSLHFIMLRKGDIRTYWREPEFRIYISLFFIASIAIMAWLYLSGTEASISKAIRDSMFQVSSFMTTAGFGSVNLGSWLQLIQLSLLFLGAIGGCAGSTSGGVKIIRLILLGKQSQREIQRLVHPNGVFHIKLGGFPVPVNVINATWGFLAAYVMSFIILMLLLMATGLDQVTAFSTLLACISNTGPALGEAINNYGNLNNSALWLLSFAMLLGRLEVFTVLVLFSRTFWRV